MKKNWLISAILMGILFIGLIVFVQFVGFTLTVKSHDGTSKTIKFVGLFYESLSGRFDTNFLGKKYSIYYLSQFSKVFDVSGFNTLCKNLWGFIIALITISGFGLLYSIIMILNTDKFDFNQELAVGIVYALLSVSCTILGILIFTGWYYFVDRISIFPIYTGLKISKGWLTELFTLIVSILTLCSYVYKLIALFLAE